MDYSLIFLLIFLMFSGAVIVGVVLVVYLANLSREVKALTRRVATLETGAAAARTVSSAEPSKIPTEPVAAAQPPPPPPPRPPGPTIPFEMKKPDWNIETLIGGRVLNRVGIILFIFGVGFFIKYAFDNRWIGETGRVIIGLIVGLIFLGLGEWYQRKDYRYFFQGLTGGGIAILYLSIYAAFGFYDLIPQAAAFLFMIVVTAAGVALAVRYKAVVVASLATLGGFMTPFILSTGVDNQATLLTYIFLLNAGILAIAYFRNWPLLNYQSFILTVIAFSAWGGRFYESEKLWPTVFFLTIFFVLFAFLAILNNIVNRRKASAPELILAFVNAALYFGAMYFLLEDKHHGYLGLFSLAMGAAYVSLAYMTNARHREDRFLIWVFLGMAATFVTLAIPIQLKQNWITIGWAIEGAALAYVAYRYDSRNTRVAAFAILCLVFIRLLFFDVRLSHQFVQDEFMLFFNKRVFSYIVGIAAMGVTAYLFSREDRGTSPEGKIMAGVLLIAANLSAIVLLSVEAYDYLRHLRYQDRIAPSILRYAQQLSLSIIWGIYATGLIAMGIRKRHAPLRYMALLLFAVTILKVFAFDLSELRAFYRIVSAIGLGMLLIAVSFLYQKYKDILLGAQPEEGGSE